MVVTFRIHFTLFLVFGASGRFRQETSCFTARAAAAASGRTATVVVRSSVSVCVLREVERFLAAFLGSGLSPLLSVVVGLPVPEVALGSGDVSRLAGEAVRRCAKGHPLPLVHAPFGK